MPTQTDVVIIGAGAAGLAAAKELTNLGVDHIVVEASHRIGGRAYSEEIGPGTWFDLGCAYLVAGPDIDEHVDESNPFIDFAREQGEIIEKYVYPSRYVFDGRGLDTGQMSDLEKFYADCEDAIRDSAKSGDDVAISDIVDLENPYAIPYMDMMTVTAPKDLDEASAADFFYKIEEFSNHNTRHGYGNLVARWGSDVNVSLNSKVESIDWSGHGVSVKTVKGDIKARCVICTVSTGVMAAEHIEFSPRLPDWKMDAFRGVTMGAENKIGIHFTEEVFAPADSGYYQVWSSDAQGAYVDVNLVSTNIVTVFVGGRFSIWMEQQGPQAAREFALDRIADIFGNDIRKSAGRSIASAWVTDPWTLGSYAAALPGQFHQRKALPRPIDDRLFFAGEATARANGTCNGAYWSGIRAAREVSTAIS